MDAALAAKRGLKPLGVFRGLSVAACEPDEMGIGPVFAVPRLLQRFGLKMDDIGLWELNEAFAVQVVYCRDKLGIPMDRLNGMAAPCHRTSLRMSGSRMVGTRSSRASARREVRRVHDVHRAAWVRQGFSSDS